MVETARRRRLPPEARRRQLLDCAVAVFAAQGLARAGHAGVAEAAGVSVATVFHYFPTREALVDAVLDRVEAYFVALATEVHARPLPLSRRLVLHGLAFLATADTRPGHLRVWLDWSTAVREHVWPRYLAFQERLVAIVAESIERGSVDGEIPSRVSSEQAARLFVGNAHMAATLRFAPSTGLDLAAYVESAVAMILNLDERG